MCLTVWIVRKEKQNMVKTDRQKAMADCDRKWANSVKERVGWKCEYCGKNKEQTVLHSHHIFSRRHLGTRWELNNGICLCTEHHLYLAHRDTATFMLWLQRNKGTTFIETLEIKAHGITKYSTSELKLIAKNWDEFNKTKENVADIIYRDHISDGKEVAA